MPHRAPREWVVVVLVASRLVGLLAQGADLVRPALGAELAAV